MIELIGAIGGVVSGVALPLADRIFGAAGRAQARNLSFTTKMRALYFEVTSNLRTLALISMEKLTPANLSALAASLELETCAAVLFAEDGAANETRTFLELQGRVSVSGEDGDEEKPGGEKQKSVLQALLFVVQRITALQKIAFLCSAQENALINVRLAARVGNIREHLEFIKRKLREFDKEAAFLFRE